MALQEPAALAALRAVAGTSSAPELQAISAAIGALWEAIGGLHETNEVSHNNIRGRLDSLDGNAASVAADGQALAIRVAELEARAKPGITPQGTRRAGPCGQARR